MTSPTLQDALARAKKVLQHADETILSAQKTLKESDEALARIMKENQEAQSALEDEIIAIVNGMEEEKAKFEKELQQIETEK